MRSATMPSSGENSVPSHASAAMMTRYCTEPVVDSTYQPRISASISKAHDVARSAGHWKRKLRTANGARAAARPAGGGDVIGPDATRPRPRVLQAGGLFQNPAPGRNAACGAQVMHRESGDLAKGCPSARPSTVQSRALHLACQILGNASHLAKYL